MWYDEIKEKNKKEGIKEIKMPKTKNAPPLLSKINPFSVTLPVGETYSFKDLISEGIVRLNIPSGTNIQCSDCSPNGSSFYSLLKEINVEPGNQTCASDNGILYSSDKKILYACPAAYDKNVVIPNTVETIGERAFKGCRFIKEVVIPDSVKTIGSQAFADCKALNKVVMSDNITSFGKEVFLRCSKIISAGPKNTAVEKFNFEFSWTEKIPEDAFSGMRKLKKVVLPDSIEAIGKNAFKGCKELEAINIPASLKIPSNLFKDCNKLNIQETPFTIMSGNLVLYRGNDSEVRIPEGVVSIEQNAFLDSKNIKKLILPTTLEKIDSMAFQGCKQLEDLVVQSEIKKVGSCAFRKFDINSNLEIYICSKISIQAFSAPDDKKWVLSIFLKNITEFDRASNVFKKNLCSADKQMKEYIETFGYVHDWFIENYTFRNEMYESRVLSVDNIDWLISAAQEKERNEVVAELLAYKNTLLSEKSVVEKIKKKEQKSLEKELSGEFSAQELKKIFKCSYTPDGIIIKGVKEKMPVITIPSKIGKKDVVGIYAQAFCDICLQKYYPEQIIISEGISYIDVEAFLLVKNAEIFFPTTVKKLPKGCFYCASELTLHLPETLEEIHIGKPILGEHEVKCIYGKVGSYAEVIAKENNITFIEE